MTKTTSFEKDLIADRPLPAYLANEPPMQPPRLFSVARVFLGVAGGAMAFMLLLMVVVNWPHHDNSPPPYTPPEEVAAKAAEEAAVAEKTSIWNATICLAGVATDLGWGRGNSKDVRGRVIADTGEDFIIQGKYRYRCRLDGSQIQRISIDDKWANGKWEESWRGYATTYRIQDGQIVITQNFGEDAYSARSYSYSPDDLRKYVTFAPR